MRANVRLALLALAVAFSVCSALPALAKETAPTPSPNLPTSGDLVNHPKQWDGKTIDFTGEAITQAMIRGDYAWLHLNDDPYYLENTEEGAELGGYNSGHAVWIPAELARKIRFFGDYRHEGDVVKVTGTFNAACPVHGGDMDIHATALEVVTTGHDVVDPIKPGKALAALLLLALAAALWFAHRRAEHMDLFGSIARRRA